MVRPSPYVEFEGKVLKLSKPTMYAVEFCAGSGNGDMTAISARFSRLWDE